MADAMATGKYQFVMCNFAPPDMVGHTGVYDAAVLACTATGGRGNVGNGMCIGLVCHFL